jgi:NAD(P)-dependent dehydrogenase (short-subunit alcohol dehydrogenase family)
MMGTYIIIGGSGGIGNAISRRIKAAAQNVFLIGRNAQSLEALAVEIGAEHAVADVTDPSGLAKAVAAAGPSIDGLCYAAGTINLKPISRLTPEDFKRDFEVNALGAALAVQAALPALKASTNPSASVLFFSTVAVAQGFAAHASVGMAKGAIEGLVRSLAAELAPKIRVNAIAPSLTKTPLAKALTSNEQMANSIAALHPLQRLGEPDDVAALAALLLLPESGWITGQIIGVDGGRSTLRTKG